MSAFPFLYQRQALSGLSSSDISKGQKFLKEQGCYFGPIDGVVDDRYMNAQVLFVDKMSERMRQDDAYRGLLSAFNVGEATSGLRRNSTAAAIDLQNKVRNAQKPFRFLGDNDADNARDTFLTFRMWATVEPSSASSSSSAVTSIIPTSSSSAASASVGVPVAAQNPIVRGMTTLKQLGFYTAGIDGDPGPSYKRAQIAFARQAIQQAAGAGLLPDDARRSAESLVSLFEQNNDVSQVRAAQQVVLSRLSSPMPSALRALVAFTAFDSSSWAADRYAGRSSSSASSSAVQSSAAPSSTAVSQAPAATFTPMSINKSSISFTKLMGYAGAAALVAAVLLPEQPRKNPQKSKRRRR